MDKTSVNPNQVCVSVAKRRMPLGVSDATTPLCLVSVSAVRKWREFWKSHITLYCALTVTPQEKRRRSQSSDGPPDTSYPAMGNPAVPTGT